MIPRKQVGAILNDNTWLRLPPAGSRSHGRRKRKSSAGKAISVFVELREPAAASVYGPSIVAALCKIPGPPQSITRPNGAR
jgi:hypothetical protein